MHSKLCVRMSIVLCVHGKRQQPDLTYEYGISNLYVEVFIAKKAGNDDGFQNRRTCQDNSGMEY